MKCIECNQTAEYIFWGQSLCQAHFNEHKKETEEAANNLLAPSYKQ